MHTTSGKCCIILLILIAALAACGAPSPTPALASITVQLRWTHQAQFGGFYAADQNHDYAAEGLAVSFLEGGPNIDMLSPVLDGKAQFGILNADALILARADGKSVRAIATIYRRSPTVYMTLATSGIRRPQDFVGKTIAIGTNGHAFLHAMMARVGIQPDRYTIVNPGSDLAPFYSGQEQVRGAFLTNEVLTAKAAGHELNLIFPDDYGIHFYADTLFTTDDFIASHPDIVARFLRATLKGWTYAVENSTAVGPLVAKYNPKADIAHETAFMTASLPLINTGEDHIGWMKPAIWAGMAGTLREQQALTKPLDVLQVYTMQFLNEMSGS